MAGDDPQTGSPLKAGNLCPLVDSGGSVNSMRAVKTAIIGASGYIGRHLLCEYRRSHPENLGTTFSTADSDLLFFDIRQPDIQQLRLEEGNYGAVLIASAKSNVAFCENNPEASYAVNVRGTLELIRQIGQTSIQVIFLSSDYVFDGSTGRYDDAAQTRPTTEYGRQKAIVERELPSLAKNHLILRLSKIYGVHQKDRTLLNEIASRLTLGEELIAARDQVFCPTYIEDLVSAITGIQSLGLRGTFNVCSPERWSRLEIALQLAEFLKVDPQHVKACFLHEISGMASRPLDTSMNCHRLADQVGATFVPLLSSMKQVASGWTGDRKFTDSSDG